MVQKNKEVLIKKNNIIDMKADRKKPSEHLVENSILNHLLLGVYTYVGHSF